MVKRVWAEERRDTVEDKYGQEANVEVEKKTS